MKSDADLFLEFDATSSYNSKAYNALSLMNSALNGGSIELLDIERCRRMANDVMDYLAAKQRFILLKKEMKELSFTNGKFKLLEHEFDNLDDVEKAIKNKAFL